MQPKGSKGVVVSWKADGASPFAAKTSYKTKSINKRGANAARDVLKIVAETGREDLYKVRFPSLFPAVLVSD
jgi:hypothetical protein